MKKHRCFLFLNFCIVVILMTACVDIEERNDSPTGNFEALWTILDEHYCFFDYKQKDV